MAPQIVRNVVFIKRMHKLGYPLITILKHHL